MHTIDISKDMQWLILSLAFGLYFLLFFFWSSPCCFCNLCVICFVQQYRKPLGIYLGLDYGYMNPYNRPTLEFDGNIAHSSGLETDKYVLAKIFKKFLKCFAFCLFEIL